ncbi:retropepsin-like aspartic protease, partial [Actinobacillus pleuropneumoniae]
IHNFIKEEFVRKVGLKFSPTQGRLKEVNSPLDKVIGIVENVDLSIGEWSRKIEFMIVRMDDYETILGM